MPAQVPAAASVSPHLPHHSTCIVRISQLQRTPPTSSSNADRLAGAFPPSRISQSSLPRHPENTQHQPDNAYPPKTGLLSKYLLQGLGNLLVRPPERRGETPTLIPLRRCFSQPLTLIGLGGNGSGDFITQRAPIASLFSPHECVPRPIDPQHVRSRSSICSPGDSSTFVTGPVSRLGEKSPRTQPSKTCQRYAPFPPVICSP